MKVILKRFLLFLILSFILTLPYPRFFVAAREAEVISDSTSLYEKPKTDGPVSLELQMGDRVRIGNKEVKGWVKGFLLQDGKKASSAGFLQIKDLKVAGAASEVTPKKKKKKSEHSETETTPKDSAYSSNKKYYVGFLTPLTFHALKPLESYLLLADAGVTKMEIGFAGEFGYQLFDNLWGQFRLEYLKTKQVFDASATGGSSTASYTFSSLYLAVAPEYQMAISPFIQMDLGLGLGAFLNLDVTLASTGRSASSPSFDPVFSLMPRVGMRIYLSKVFSIGLGGGYRYALETASANTASLSYLGLSAPFVDIGLRLKF